MAGVQCEPITGVWREIPSGVQGQSPGQGVRGKASWSWKLVSFLMSKRKQNLATLEGFLSTFQGGKQSNFWPCRQEAMFPILAKVDAFIANAINSCQNKKLCYLQDSWLENWKAALSKSTAALTKRGWSSSAISKSTTDSRLCVWIHYSIHKFPCCLISGRFAKFWINWTSLGYFVDALKIIHQQPL